MARRAVRRKPDSAVVGRRGAGMAVRSSSRKSAGAPRRALATRKEKGGMTAPIVQRRRPKREMEGGGEEEDKKGEALVEEEEEEEEEETAVAGGDSVDSDGSPAGGTEGETEYERRRRENVARNAAKLAELGVASAAQLVASSAAAGGTHNRKAGMVVKGLRPGRAVPMAAAEPAVLRRSLRAKKIKPDPEHAGGIRAELRGGHIVLEDTQPDGGGGSGGRRGGPVELRSANASEAEDERLIAMLRRLREAQSPLVAATAGGRKEVEEGAGPPLSSLRLHAADVARVVKERIFCIAFLPARVVMIGREHGGGGGDGGGGRRDKVIVAAGDKAGQLGVWDVDPEPPAGDAAGVYLFELHAKPVSGLAFAAHDYTKLYTCSYDGSLRALDLEARVFAEVLHSHDDQFSALALAPSPGTAYIGDGDGCMSIFDPRAGAVVAHHQLHQRKVSTLELNPAGDGHLLLTASTDTAVRLWDVRRLGAGELASALHGKGVNSAAFSPDGRRVASTSYDNTVRIWDIEPPERLRPARTVAHDNNTGRWISAFRGVWAWDGSHVLVGSMAKARAIDAVDADSGSVARLSSEHMTSICARLAVHPLLPAVVAGGTAGGKLCLWRATRPS
eukprot:SM000121S25973  [mRNA]  locus=s121:8606:11476:+ [translate_table: standard]